MARGPRLFLLDVLLPGWAKAMLLKSNASAVKVTARRPVRYKVGAEGETFMDVNDKAPEFTLPDQNGKDISLKEFRGQKVVLFFYPRADTPGCTIEVCEFRDSHKKIQKPGAVLLGISPDTSNAQK